MSVAEFIGDEVSAAGYRLCGIDVHIADSSNALALITAGLPAGLAGVDRQHDGTLYKAHRTRCPAGEYPAAGAGGTRCAWLAGGAGHRHPHSQTTGYAGMKPSATDPQQDNATLEHLLAVVAENREQRCAHIRDDALTQASEIIRQAHQHNRASMHRHIVALREKYRLRVTAAQARNETRIRKQHHMKDRAVLDAAWPMLQQAIAALWEQPQSRRAWMDAAISIAASTLLEHDWHIEHPRGPR